MNIQDAAVIAVVLTEYERQSNEKDGAEKAPIAQLMERAFPKFQWTWNPLSGRYEAVMAMSDGKQVRGVIELQEE